MWAKNTKACTIQIIQNQRHCRDSEGLSQMNKIVCEGYTHLINPSGPESGS